MTHHRGVAIYAATAAALACLGFLARAALAQEPLPPSTIDCGPIRVNVNDFVALNVGNPGRAPQIPAVLLFRVLDPSGAALLETQVTLAPGQSRAIRWPAGQEVVTGRQAMVRGEVVELSGPTNLKLVGTLQVFKPGLTYGPNVSCWGDTGGRGPV
jgi:hypothetical protein